MKRKPQASPINGDSIMKAATSSTVDHFTADSPAAEIPAPVIPPIRAWEEDVGRPQYQVIRFQLIAPMREQSTIMGIISACTKSSLIILLMVLATATPKPKAAMKLKKAANATAFLGERTLVETTVDIAFAESWNPFVKSKISAMNMIAMTMIRVAVSMTRALLFTNA
jgi:hypothetical protein